MSATLSPYLNFRGDAAAAMELYRSVLGGELSLTTFADAGGMGLPAEDQGLVMHSALMSPAGTLMGADTPSHVEPGPVSGFSVSLSGGPEDDATLRAWWEGLSDGAREVSMPLAKAPWGDTFGMLVDRFGISWMVNIGGQPQG